MNSGGGGNRALPRWQEWNLGVTAKKWNKKTKVRRREREGKREGRARAK
jgi:hypothetical protein